MNAQNNQNGSAAQAGYNLYIYPYSYSNNVRNEQNQRVLEAAIRSGRLDKSQLGDNSEDQIGAIVKLLLRFPVNGQSAAYYVSAIKEKDYWLVIRPEVGPRLDRLFPGDLILGVRGRVCGGETDPARAFNVDSLVWFPKSGAADWETRVRLCPCYLLCDFKDNFLTPACLAELCKTSSRLNTRLQPWYDYLDWREAQTRAENPGVDPNDYRSPVHGDFTVYTRQRSALNDLATLKSTYTPVVNSYLSEIGHAKAPTQGDRIEFVNDSLNDSQKAAVRLIVNAPDLALIQGPPGTGKTTVIAEAVYQLVSRNQRVLIASQSVAAVDNALERLYMEDGAVQPVRLKRIEKEGQTSELSGSNAIGFWYQGLRSASQSQLDNLESQESRFVELQKLCMSVAALNSRRGHAQDQIDRLNDEIREPESQIRQAQQQKAAAQREIDERQHSVWFLAGLASNSGTGATAVSFEGVSSDWIEQVERALTPVFEPLKNRGCHPFLNYASSMSAAKRAAELTQGTREWFRIAALEPEWAQLTERIERQLGEEILTPEAAREIQTLQNRLEEITKTLDSCTDEQYIHLSKELSVTRSRIKTLKSEGGLPIALIDQTFNVRDENGLDVSQVLTGAGQSRSQTLPILAGIRDGIAQTKERFAAVMAELNERLSKPAEAEIARLKGEQTRLDQTIAKFKTDHSRLLDARAQQSQSLEELGRQIESYRRGYAEANQLQLAELPRDPAEFQELLKKTFAQYESRMNQLVHNCAPYREIISDMTDALKFWSDLLDKPQESACDQLAPTYFKTCNVTGATCMENDRTFLDNGVEKFDVVLIDEVSKTTLPELLLPMSRARKTILIGDHRQLPPTFNAHFNGQRGDDQIDAPRDNSPYTDSDFNRYRRLVENSLFKQYFEQASPAIKVSLNVQFRMHPQIMQVVNLFYDNKLECGLKNPDVERSHGLSLPYLKPNNHVLWIDSSQNENGRWNREETAETSCRNYLEARLILQTLIDMDKSLSVNGTSQNGAKQKIVGIIALYAGQTACLKQTINSYISKNGWFRNLRYKVSTVDMFQGQEADFVFVSLTRNGRYVPRSRNAFIKRFERVNVAFSRARELLVVVGATQYFQNISVNVPPVDSGAYRELPIYRETIDYISRAGGLVSPSVVLLGKGRNR